MRLPQGGVGFFDSGIGGLTVMAACRRELPAIPFYYYGDNRHAPYGNLSKGKIKRYVFRAFRRFERLKVSAVVLACNTATAVCVEELRRRYSFPVIGVEPAVCLAAREGGEVLVLSTRATYESVRYEALCQRAARKYPSAKIRSYPCDGLAGAIEKSLGKGVPRLEEYLPKSSPRTVVLGCTHYPYIRKQIEEFFGAKTIDGNEGVARRLKGVLEGGKTPENTQNHFRPPAPHFCLRKGGEPSSCAQMTKRGLFRRKQNKRSFLMMAKDLQSQESKGEEGIFFLGSSKNRNKIVYKQMFV